MGAAESALETKLTAAEKADFVAFLRALKFYFDSGLIL